jgi:hypothetical protein
MILPPLKIRKDPVLTLDYGVKITPTGMLSRFKRASGAAVELRILVCEPFV